MALKGKIPEAQPTRLKCLIYGNKGIGKTHFCCQFPDAYFIDTEGVDKYAKFAEMLKANRSAMATIYDIGDIIQEVKLLMAESHDYKTLIIDSSTFPYAFCAQTEAERLISKNKDPNKEGTEYGANLAKPKRLFFHLATLLTRLDMNVIVTAHEKTKYEDGKESGKEPDIHEKVGYALGTQIHLVRQGKFVKGYIEKTRYDELPDREFIDLTNGFETIKSLFGADIFLRQSATAKLATESQVAELTKLVLALKVEQSIIDKWFAKSNSMSFDTMPADAIQKCIDHLKKQINLGE